MTAKEILLEQFTACYDENGWFVALKNALENLTAAQALWKTQDGANSVWEILSHLNYYNRAYVERFKGVDYVYPKNTNDETFSSAETASEEAWRREVDCFEAIMNEWRDLIAAADEKKFGEAVSAKNQSPWASVLAHINIHNAHHGGQIVLIRKLQGSWDTSRGVS